MSPPVDTKDPAAVAAFVSHTFASMYPAASRVLVKAMLADVEMLFAGRHPDYAAVDVHYHDLEHTLQATVCLVLLLEGRFHADAEPRISARGFELALASVLLHDTGYLRLRSDTTGTGAKYTFCHVLRSCAFAASYLPSIGLNRDEVEAVLSAINCTGPTEEISRMRFRQPTDRIIGCAVATADFLGQLAAADYPDELEILFNEFKESDDFTGVPHSRRIFASAEELIERTPAFWRTIVLPKLDTDFQAVYRFLARPYPQGPNAYMEAVERNISEIQQRISASHLVPR